MKKYLHLIVAAAAIVIFAAILPPAHADDKPTPKEGFSMTVKAADGRTYKLTSYAPQHGILDVRENDKLLGTVGVNAQGEMQGATPNSIDDYKALEAAHAAWVKAGGPAVLKERRKADQAHARTSPPYLSYRKVLTDPETQDWVIKKALDKVNLKQCSDAAIKKDPKVQGEIMSEILTSQSGDVTKVGFAMDRDHGTLTKEFIECLRTNLNTAVFKYVEQSSRFIIAFEIKVDVLD